MHCYLILSSTHPRLCLWGESHLSVTLVPVTMMSKRLILLMFLFFIGMCSCVWRHLSEIEVARVVQMSEDGWTYRHIRNELKRGDTCNQKV